MERHIGLGALIALTALTVAVPVLLQVGRGEYRLRDVSGYLLFAAGLLVVGVAFMVLATPMHGYAIWAGLAAAVAGLLAQRRPGPRAGTNE
jgi:hypothetical protein